ncbi:MAG: class I SAM-dependent rRNA methyltransferase [Myxococcales bacterium]|nr:class I SAM-dependent rRNA methyltransferase [Myxococcales bacterium]
MSRRDAPGRDRPPVRSREAGPLPTLPTLAGVARAVLRPGAATPVLAGHPWVFSGAIAHLVAAPEAQRIDAGQACAVLDPHGRWLGFGYVNPDSQISVRVLEPGSDGLEPRRVPALDDLVRARLQRAADLRRALGLPGPETDAYRLANAEGDGLPGLVVDRFADGAVVQASTAGAWRWRAGVVAWLRGTAGCAWVLVRVPHDVHPSEGLVGDTLEAHGDVPESVRVHHNGLLLMVEPRGGQKTGMYCDQRAAHRRVADLVRPGSFVLDAYCHTGGFGLHAARAGAGRVLGIDASLRAVELANTHAALNGLDAYRADCEDAVLTLRHYAESASDAPRPDVVVVDPPKFATRGAVVDDALRKYLSLNALAMRALAEDGWLATCSCSGLVTREAFLRMLAQAAREAGRRATIVDVLGPAPDHPVAPAHAEGNYLKTALVRVTARDV